MKHNLLYNTWKLDLGNQNHSCQFNLFMTNSSLRRKSEFPLNVTRCLLGAYMVLLKYAKVYPYITTIFRPYLIFESLNNKIIWKDWSLVEKRYSKKHWNCCCTVVCSFTFSYQTNILSKVKISKLRIQKRKKTIYQMTDHFLKVSPNLLKDLYNWGLIFKICWRTTDKRREIWSRDFLIWKINFGLWAVAWAV